MFYYKEYIFSETTIFPIIYYGPYLISALGKAISQKMSKIYNFFLNLLFLNKINEIIFFYLIYYQSPHDIIK